MFKRFGLIIVSAIAAIILGLTTAFMAVGNTAEAAGGTRKVAVSFDVPSQVGTNETFYAVVKVTNEGNLSASFNGTVLYGGPCWANVPFYTDRTPGTDVYWHENYADGQRAFWSGKVEPGKTAFYKQTVGSSTKADVCKNFASATFIVTTPQGEVKATQNLTVIEKPAPDKPVNFTLTSPSTTVEVGKTMEVAITADTQEQKVGDIYAKVNLPTNVKTEGVKVGNCFPSGGVGETNSANIKDGKVVFHGNKPQGVALKNCKLAIITLQGVTDDTGQATFDKLWTGAIKTAAGDFQKYSVSLGDLKVTVKASATPSPTTTAGPVVTAKLSATNINWQPGYRTFDFDLSFSRPSPYSYTIATTCPIMPIDMSGSGGQGSLGIHKPVWVYIPSDARGGPCNFTATGTAGGTAFRADLAVTIIAKSAPTPSPTPSPTATPATGPMPQISLEKKSGTWKAGSIAGMQVKVTTDKFFQWWMSSSCGLTIFTPGGTATATKPFNQGVTVWIPAWAGNSCTIYVNGDYDGKSLTARSFKFSLN